MDLETVKLSLGAVAAFLALWFVGARLIRFLRWVETSEIARQQAEAAERGKAARAAAPAPAAALAEAQGVPAPHVAAIAAAVAACGYRVVHIADAGAGHAWAAEGRWLHQTSHHTH